MSLCFARRSWNRIKDFLHVREGHVGVTAEDKLNTVRAAYARRIRKREHP